MGTLKVDVEDKLLELFKKKAMKLYGYKKGSLKLATENLIKRWIQTKEVNWKSLRGVLRFQGSSVQLQHQIWKKVD